MPVLIELDGFTQRRVLLHEVKERSLFVASAVTLAHCFDDSARVNTLMYVEGNSWDFKRGMLGLARPDQLRVKVGVIGIGLFAGLPIGFQRYQTNGRVVDALLVPMIVLLDWFLLRHVNHPPLSNLLLEFTDCPSYLLAGLSPRIRTSKDSPVRFHDFLEQKAPGDNSTPNMEAGVSNFIQCERIPIGRKGSDDPFVRKQLRHRLTRRHQVAICRDQESNIVLIVIGVPEQFDGDVYIRHLLFRLLVFIPAFVTPAWVELVMSVEHLYAGESFQSLEEG